MKRILCSVLIFCLAFTLVPSAVFAEEAVDNSHLITYQKPGTFDYEIATDPMQIADDEFFGVWDEEAQDWEKQPYFRYDEFPDMIKVKEAAMAADYDLAKDELLNYYLEVRDSRYTKPTSNPGATAKSIALALEKNVYAISGFGEVKGYLNFDNDWKEYSVDVTTMFGSKVNGTVKDIGVLLMSVDKHLTQAEVKSRESDNPPVLELVVNGLPQKIYASKDIMIRGGAYGAQNYGSDEILTIQESGYYKNFNENTKRAIIAFDISNLKTTDKVTSAILKINGRNASGTGEKEICVYDYSEMTFDENTANFDELNVDCPIWSCNDENTWNFITSNNTSIKGKSCLYHRGNELNNIANMYSYTGDERYAYTFIRQHMGLVHNVGFNADVFNALDIGVHLRTASGNVFQVLDSKYMTGEILTAMIKTFWLQAQQNIYNFYGTKDNNWATYATSGTYAFLSRFRELAVFDEWYKLTQEENYRVVKGFVLEDGMSLELPLGYTQVILGTISAPFEIQDETGIPVPFGDEVMSIAYNIVKTLVNCSSPGWRGYNIADADDYQSNYSDVVKKWYIMAFPDDEMFEYVATNGTSGAMPENPTTRYPTSLRTYMRSSWDSKAIAMSFINTNDLTASHGQRDHLSITLFAYGKFLLTDPGLGKSLLDGAKEYMSSAPMHNLVTVNNSEHDKISKTRELAFESNNVYDFIEYAGTYTQDVNQSRSILYLKDQKFFIVGDYANPENQTKENSFEQNWQMLPASKISVDEQTLEIRSNNDDINVNLVPVGTDDLTYYYEDTNFSHKSAEEANKKAVLKKTAVGDAVFNTIILPRNIKEDFEVSADVVDTGIDPAVVNAFSARIKNTLTGKENYYYYYHLNDLSKKQEANVGQFTTDATTMLVETDLDGNITSTFLMDATFLKDNTIDEEGQYLFKVKEGSEPVSAIAYEKNGQIFNVYSSTLNEEVLENVTMYAPGQYNVRFEGSFMDGKKSGDYLYFGDEPIIVGKDTDDSEDSEDNVQTPEKPSGGVHGSGSSGGGGGSSGGGSVTPVVPVDPTPVEPTPSVPEKPSFTDVSSDSWYYGYVEELAENGIVAGDEKGKFNPNDNVTREQFLKMLIEATDIEAEEGENNFSDVKDAWYKAYVLKAKSLGIVNGVSATEFGIGSNITRQDMAVMISRVIDKLEIKTDKTDADEFADNGKVSEYAKASVMLMKSIGLIEGYNNEYRPLDNLTRAEAAKVISELLKLL